MAVLGTPLCDRYPVVLVANERHANVRRTGALRERVRSSSFDARYRTRRATGAQIMPYLNSEFSVQRELTFLNCFCA